jgi:4-hydroxybenzoate polyprenyltransferase
MTRVTARTLSKPVALALSTHPIPGIAVTVITLVLCLTVGLDGLRTTILTVAILANQLSVGWSNDWIDAERDREASRTDKPVARGDISVEAVRIAAFVSAAIAIALPFLLNPAVGIAHAIFVISAWSYNAGLKNTVISVVPYVVSFGLLPVLIGLALPDPAPVAWWAVVAGATIGIAAHFANVLPDLADDDRTGVRGLPHRLGLRGAGITAFVVLVVTAVVTASAAGLPLLVALLGLLIIVGLATYGIALVLTRPPTRILFQLILLSALVLVVMLALSGQHLLA